MTENVDRVQLEELEEKLFEVTNDCTDLDTIFSGLQNIMTFWMSTLCPDCRNNVARKLKNEISQMLAEANEFAAEESTEHQCH